MLRKLLVVGVSVFLCNVAIAGDKMEAKTCTCEVIIETGEGFCDVCNKGQIFGEKLTSRKLYETLHGHSVDTAKMTCDGCKRAVEKGSTCAVCKVGFASGHMYHSPMAHSMALGTPYSAEKASNCRGCKIAFAENSVCSKCEVGFLDGRIYHTRNRHNQAETAHKVIHVAILMSDKCEDCAIAMVTNSKCEKCNIRFQNGRSVGGAPADHERKKKPND